MEDDQKPESRIDVLYGWAVNRSIERVAIEWEEIKHPWYKRCLSIFPWWTGHFIGVWVCLILLTLIYGT